MADKANQNLMLMKIGYKSSSTNETIIRILSDKWPLTAKEIHRELGKEGTEITYQGVHKILRSLLDSNILTRKGNAFQLSSEWISGMKKYFSGLEEKYSGTMGKYEFEKGREETTWKFTDYSTMSVTLAKLLMSKKLVGNADPIGIGVIRHGIFPLDFNFYDFDLMFKMVKYSGGGYALIQSNSPFDKWIAEQYRKAGFNGVKIGMAELNLQKDIIVHGDHYIEIAYSDNTIEFLDKFFDETKGIESLYGNFLKKKTSGTLDISVKIIKNPQMAQFIKNQMIEKYFSGEKK